MNATNRKKLMMPKVADIGRAPNRFLSDICGSEVVGDPIVNFDLDPFRPIR
jgi:hypothetical protein